MCAHSTLSLAATGENCLQQMRAQGAVAPIPLNFKDISVAPPSGYKPPWGLALSNGCLVADIFKQGSVPFIVIANGMHNLYRWYPFTGQTTLWAAAPIPRNAVTSLYPVAVYVGTSHQGFAIGDGFSFSQGDDSDSGYRCSNILSWRVRITDPRSQSHAFYYVRKLANRANPEVPCEESWAVRRSQLLDTGSVSIVHLSDGTFAILDQELQHYMRLDQNYRQHSTLHRTDFILAAAPTYAAITAVAGRYEYASDTIRYSIVHKLLLQGDPKIVGVASEETIK